MRSYNFDLEQKTFEIIDHLAKQKDVLGLKESVVRGNISLRTPTARSAEDIYGRDEDKEKLKTLLLTDDASSGDISVIPIVGMDGVGKTTLAQLLYNDNRVKEYFDVRAWVRVSQDFDPVRVTKTLFESIASKPVGNLDMILLQEEFREQVRGKKFLFVLDDLQNGNYNDWNFLQAPFTYGARGSRVIVTTRSTIVASLVHTVSIYHLPQLSKEYGCPFLLSLLEGLLNNMVHNSNHLQKLSIWNCPFLTLFPSDRLPTTLTTLHLQECPSLLSFPRDGLPSMLKLLEITNCRKLEFLTHKKMIPKFAYLETLNISCSCDSLTSFPLGLFPQLKNLSIWSCVNLESLSFEPVEGEISHLKSLSVFGCKNLKSLPKQLHAFNDLRELRISSLPNLESVAEEGLPLNLEVFEVCYCDKLKPSAKWRLEESFLRQFSIGGRGSEDLFRTLLKEKLLPTTLENLYIYGLPSLKSFDGKGLQHLTSLKRLQIHCCDNLEFLPEEGLPISLSFLSIERCPSLKKRYRNKRGDDWSKIAGIPCIKIDEKVII
ncbi:unnamed protein product [Malus baccata var. baccata]